ncbi:hypothetical protein F0726_02318 [Acidithiobacillus caldus]|nr:hypothetical protein F0726_02318 [Acidithiobacillus caldus]
MLVASALAAAAPPFLGAEPAVAAARDGSPASAATVLAALA